VEKSAVIKYFCTVKNNKKEKEKMKKEVKLLLLQVWKTCSFIDTNGVPVWQIAGGSTFW